MRLVEAYTNWSGYHIDKKKKNISGFTSVLNQD